MIEYLVGVALGLQYVREYRLEEISLISRPKVVHSSATPLQPFVRTSETRQFFLTQAGILDFELREISNLENSLLATEKNHDWNGDNNPDFHQFILEYENSPQGKYRHFNTLPVIKRVSADDYQELARLFTFLGRELQPHDLFYFATTRHGSFDKKKGLLNKFMRKSFRVGEKALCDFYEVDEDERRQRSSHCAYFGRAGDYRFSVTSFEQLFAPVSASGALSVLYFDTCFGGDFAQRMGTRNTIAISPIRPGKFLTMQSPAQNLLTGEWEDQSIPDPSVTRCEFETRLIDGKSVLSAFQNAGDSLRFMNTMGIPWRPIINQPRMYVGNVDPSSVYFK